jgi:crotonobetainyl-CoA:carnitine CoA-transferase CaiB-like acyl-CoA transferase
VYEASDEGRLAVGAVEPKFWQRTVELLGHPEWGPRQHDPALREELQALIGTRSLVYWTALLERPDTCVTGVSTPGDLLKDPQARSRQAITEHPTPAGPLPRVASPFRAAPARPEAASANQEEEGR